ncbi:glycosyltransferase family 9 protein [Solwaraspora sp. WMMD1047]|uniref:glycosyltransferase family 9 protein n=1 Tax=Solwaraspora sp. WMMD1047 TaxID=3016102 RepID=UPI0024164A4E|nr:glycosyltransferase family 9 protein [Solwaraspora sp. WMMD1047]MDG4830227.1 glycosyltransferase family 9 protein [Solwaraspora sp. WMMD1047]
MILVLRALGVGDLATAVPALRGLRAAYPDRTLALAAPGWLAPLVGLVGAVDRLIPLDGLPGAGLPARSPYRAVNLHGRGPQSHELLLATRPGRLIAFRCPAAGHPGGPDWTADEHEVRRWCRLLDWYGVPTDPTDLTLRPPGPRPVPVGATVLHPGGKDALRRWSPSRFARLAGRLARSGHRVVVTGSAGERELAERVAADAGLPADRVLAGRTGLLDLAALVAGARLVISADTGVAHLATGYGTPSVVLFGPIRPDHWGPPPDRPWHRVIWSPAAERSPAGASASSASSPVGLSDSWPADPWPADRADRPDGERLHPALAAIGVDRVWAAVEEVDVVGRRRGAVAA